MRFRSNINYKSEDLKLEFELLPYVQFFDVSKLMFEVLIDKTITINTTLLSCLINST